MSQNVIQPSFAAGELSPTLFSRVDMAKYHVGAALMRNFFVDYRNGASNRTGTRLITRGLLDTGIRLIPFQFSVVQGYVLEFGDGYMRVIKNGSLVLNTGFAITNITNASGAVVTAAGNTFNSGDVVFISGVVGMDEVNGNYYKVIVIVAGLTFGLYTLDNPPLAYPQPINSTAFGTYFSGGTVAGVYAIASPYAAADLALLKFSQSASVMTFTHPSYGPYNLTRVADNNWSFTVITFQTSATPPVAGFAIATTTAGAVNYSYVVTSVFASGEESNASVAQAIASANVNTTANTISISWTAVAGAVSYNVYRAEHSTAGAVPAGLAYGYVSTVYLTSFIDSGWVPDFASTPPVHSNPFFGNAPGVNAYFQQRQVFAGSNSQPQTLWMSQPGGFSPTTANFDVSDPIQDDDAITATLVSSQVNTIKALIGMPGGLLTLTGKGAWQISGGSGNAAVTPANIVAVPQAYNGISDVPPIVSNYDILYVQEKGSRVRDLSYNIYANIYTGVDISILSNHLFFGHEITGWAYAEEPFQQIQCVREDGIMLALTFVKEQEIYGWSHYDTLGLFKSVCSITEEGVDAVYVAVQRPIGAGTSAAVGIWYIERFANRDFPYGVEDAWFVDCGLTNVLTSPAGALIPSAATGTTTFVSDNPIFTSTDVGSVIRVGGGIATIVSADTQYQVTVNITKDIDVTYRDAGNLPVAAAQGDWTMTVPFSTIRGLDHLEGQIVSILGDGNVFEQQIVVGGSITLPSPVTKVIIGLPFTAQLQTMPLDIGEPTVQGKRKKIAALTLRVRESRGLAAGPTFDDLVQVKERGPATPLGLPIPLVTSDERINMPPTWTEPGQICIQQSYPLPTTVLGVIPEIVTGDTMK